MNGLKRSNEFFGQYLRLLGQASRAHPIPGLRCLPRVFEEASDFGGQISLRGVQAPSPHGLEIFLRDGDALLRSFFRKSSLFRRELRCNQRRFRFLNVGRRRRRHADVWPRRPAPYRDQPGRFIRKIGPQVGKRVLGRPSRTFSLRRDFRSYLNGRGPGNRRPSSRTASAQRNRGATQKDKSPTDKSARRFSMGPGRMCRHVQAARGSSIRNVVPRPTSDVKSIEPL